jgi:hypothetical protein
MSFFSEHDFCLIGQYESAHSGEVLRVSHVKKITERLPLVYAMFSEKGECLYIGKSIQGFSRPLGYHKNGVMKDVQNGLVGEASAGRKVLIYARSRNFIIEHEGLELNLVHSFEQALIKKHKPRWNNAQDD